MISSENTHTDTNYEIMIVGGGPAGLSTWLHLHKYAPELAEKTLLIEKAKYPRDKLCGGGVDAWSPMVLHNLNISLDIPSLFISNLEFRYRKDTRKLHQNNCFRMVNRSEFDHALAKIALRRGMQLCENETFLNVNTNNKEAIVTTNKRKYKVKTLVGADGSLSKIRRKIQSTSQATLAPTLELFAPENPKYDSEFSEKKIVVDLNPIDHNLQGYIWHVPCIRNNKQYIGHGLVDFRIVKNKPRANMSSIFTNTLKQRKISSDPTSWKSHPIRWLSFESQLSKPHILLVGDAAGIEPAFGGGIHFALSYGDIAATTIIDSFQQNIFNYKNYKEKLQSHLIGKFIMKCTKLAYRMYNKKLNPLDVALDVFTIRK